MAYAVWASLFIVGFFYAVSKLDQIEVGDSFASVEETKGWLFSYPADEFHLGGYRHYAPFRELVADPSNKIYGYSLFGAFFTVIYDGDGKVAAMIDNGLDG